MYKEHHPLKPFLPEKAKILMLGSFPPPRKRWCMEFFYPNWTNDFWRIWGFIIKGDKNYFAVSGEKRFDKEKIMQFCRDYGIALYDTAEEIIRLKDNASDNFLQVVQPTDIASLLKQIPECHTLVATGQKSAEILTSMTGCSLMPVGGSVETEFSGRYLTIWRMPSSSRAYPRSVEWKAEYYKKMLDSANHLI